LVVEIIATDSMGVRSMATCVQAGGHIFVIDPGVALGPRRYGLAPHPLEFLAKDILWKRVKDRVEKADFVIVTHYHYDHHNPEEVEIFRDKVVFVKHPEDKINKSQRERARYFLERIRGLAREIIFADGKSFDLSRVKLVFSPAQPHGFTNRLGYVLQVAFIEGNDVFLFTSDIQGAPLGEHLDFILDVKPRILFMDGPATYLYPVRFSPKALEASLDHISRIVEEVSPEVFMVDHHTTRDERYARWFGDIEALCKEKGTSWVSAAAFMGKEELFLEAWRRRLHRNEISLSPDQIQ